MMTALLIDDEPAANKVLATLIGEHHPEIIIQGFAASVGEGVEEIRRFRPDLIFLDINLPDGRGFDLIRRLPAEQRPEMIFVTSEEAYALQAIKVAALGYLIKPVDTKELTASVQLARIRIRQRNSEQRLQALLSNLDQPDAAGQRISIPSEKGVEFVEAGKILYCKGVDGYTRIVLQDGSTRLSSYSIGEYRKMLEPLDFFGVHRSYLVNRLHVKGWADRHHLLLRNGEQVDVSRRRKALVLAWLAN